MVEITDRVKRELLWRKCAKDPVFFFENFWMIAHPKGARLFELRDPQKEAIALFESGRNVLTLKARQIGWSTLLGAYAFWLAFFHSDTDIMFISRGEREARDLLKKSRYGYDRLPPWLRERGPKLTNDNMERMNLNNGSMIVSLPSASNPGRGFTGRLVVVDEWAFIENGDEAWASIQPVADIGGQIIGLSTANGMGNFFHEHWVRTEAGETSFVPLFFGWDAVPERDGEWYERTKKDFGGRLWAFHQEYPSNPEEAFIKSGVTVFDIDMLRTRIADMLEDPQRGHVREGVAAIDFALAEDGYVRMWEPPQPGHIYAIGADVAEGLEHGDYSSAHVIDLRELRIVAAWHGHMDPDLFAEQLFMLGHLYNCALLCPEVNNHGGTVVSVLRRKGYPRLYRREVHNKVNQRVGTEIGWKTTQITKPLLVNDLHAALRDNLHMPDADAYRECLSFVRDAHGRMNGSPFDDRVISLGLAVQMVKFAHQVDTETREPDEMTGEWWAQHLQAPSTEWVIGARRRT